MDYPNIAQQIITDIDRAVVDRADVGHRTHLGASEIGDECLRKLWYKFRWVKTLRFSGRMYRLFQRGHREEPVLIDLLHQAGWRVIDRDPDTGKQFRFSACNGHFGGSLDGIGYPPPHLGLPERVLLEFKTANKDATSKILKNGMRQEKPRHWAQQHLYGTRFNLPISVYVSVNKDNDDLVCEVFDIEERIALDMTAKAQAIILSQEPPPKLSPDPTFWLCRFCDYKKICHHGEGAERNCRSCVNGVPGVNGTWYCAFHGNATIPDDQINKDHPCWRSIV